MFRDQGKVFWKSLGVLILLEENSKVLIRDIEFMEIYEIIDEMFIENYMYFENNL